jgi:hypothetical protein
MAGNRTVGLACGLLAQVLNLPVDPVDPHQAIPAGLRSWADTGELNKPSGSCPVTKPVTAAAAMILVEERERTLVLLLRALLH